MMKEIFSRLQRGTSHSNIPLYIQKGDTRKAIVRKNSTLVQFIIQKCSSLLDISLLEAFC
jgi:hypothetical protein